MKRTIGFLFVLTFFLAQSAMAQVPVHQVFDTIQVSYISQFDFKKRFDGEVLLQFHYGRSTINNREDAKLVKDLDIKKVQLLYSWYPTGHAYQEERQRALNYRRVQYLYRLLPDLFRKKGIQWELIAQTKCSSPADARNLFHGFVIQYRE